MTGPKDKQPPAAARQTPSRTRRPTVRAKPKAAAAPAESKAVAPPAADDEAAPASLSLYLVRHADAGDPTTWVGDDADRPLSKKGRRQARRLARLLKDLDVRADAVLTSSKIRAADTAKVIAKAIGTKPVTDERLTLDFGLSELAALVAGLGAEVRSALLVGHDPDFTAALSWLVGAQVPLRKGALALVDLPDREVGPGHGSLRWLLPPDSIAG